MHHLYLLFISILVLSDNLFDTMVSFAAFDITGSYQVLSIIPSISSVAYIGFGLVAGVVIERYSKRFFILTHTISFIPITLAMVAAMRGEVLGIWALAVFVMINEISSSFAKPAMTSIYYGMFSKEQASRKLSLLMIAQKVGAAGGMVVLYVYAGETENLFLSYAVSVLFALMAYVCSGAPGGYAKAQPSEPLYEIVKSETRVFLALVRENRPLFHLFVFNFLKTAFVFWPMFVGSLLKFGVEETDTRQDFILALLIMQAVCIAGSYLIGFKKTFTLRSVITGSVLSAVSIIGLAYSFHAWTHVIALGGIYLGTTLSGLAGAYIMKLELPERYTTQGLAFSVVPYYAGDILGGFAAAGLLYYLNVDALLFLTGAGLLGLCIGYGYLVKK